MPNGPRSPPRPSAVPERLAPFAALVPLPQQDEHFGVIPLSRLEHSPHRLVGADHQHLGTQTRGAEPAGDAADVALGTGHGLAFVAQLAFLRGTSVDKLGDEVRSPRIHDAKARMA